MSARLSWRSDAVWALLDQVIVSACTFLVTLVVARLVSVEAFSAFGLSVTVTLFASAMHRSYLTQPLSVLGVKEQAQALGDRFKAVVVLHLLAWPLVAGMLALVGARYFPGVGFTLAVLAYILAYLLQEAVRRLCFTTGQLRLALAMDLIAYGGYLLSLIAVGWWRGVTVEEALSIGAALFAASCLWGLIRTDAIYWRGAWPGRARVLAFAAEHWHSSKWVCFSQVFMFGSFMLVPFQIAEFGSLLWVAQYNACNAILNVLNILRQTMGNYLPIVAARVYHEQGFAAFERTMNRLSLAVLAGSGVIVLMLLLLADFAVMLLYGERYRATAEILPQASIGPLVAMVSFVTQAGGLALGKTEHIFYSYVGGMVCSVGLAPWLIPQFGLEGAVWVANVGYIVPTVWHWLVFKRDCRQMGRHEVIA